MNIGEIVVDICCVTVYVGASLIRRCYFWDLPNFVQGAKKQNILQWHKLAFVLPAW